MSQTQALRQSNERQILRFVMTGLINTGVDWSVYIILTRLVVAFASLFVVAKVFSFIIASVVALLLHRFWTFEQTGPITGAEIIRFYITTIAGIIINATALQLFLPLVAGNDLIALVLATGITTIWNFVFLKFWVYTQNTAQPATL